MVFIFHLLVIAFLWNICRTAKFPSNKIVIDVIQSGIRSENQFQIQCETSNDERNINRKLKIIDLNADVLYHILEQLELADLLNMIKSIPVISSVASSIYRKRYKDYTVDISKALNMSNGEKFTIDNQIKEIEIYDYDTSLKMLNHFGCAMQWLCIKNHNFNENRSLIINRMANEYGSVSLTSLELGRIKEDTFTQFTLPFDSVNELTFDIEVNNIRNATLPFNQIFPQLRRMTSYLRSNCDYSCIVCHFQHLEYLHIMISSFAWHKYDQIVRLIRKNPQITTIELHQYRRCLLTEIDKALPHLVNLILHTVGIGNETVHLEHVSHATLNNFHGISMDRIPLRFSHLQSIELQYTHRFYDLWQQFFSQHHTLKRLHLNVLYRGENFRLIELTEELFNLTEMSLKCISCANVDIITQLIERHEKLVKFQFNIYYFTSDELDTLRKHFEKQWNIENIEGYYQMNGFLFQRKD